MFSPVDATLLYILGPGIGGWGGGLERVQILSVQSVTGFAKEEGRL